MKRAVLLIATLFGGTSAEAHPLGATITDYELATMRGGIRLPDGTDVAIGVAIETQVNGVVALRTQFSTSQPGVQVYAGGLPATSTGAVAADSRSTAPVVDYSRNAAGTLITVAPAPTSAVLNVGTGGSLPPTVGTALAVQPNGTSVTTALGSVALRQTSGGFTSELMGNNFDVQQMIGQTTGAVIQNTGNNQAISTTTWISVDLRGIPVPSNLASTLTSAARAIVVH